MSWEWKKVTVVAGTPVQLSTVPLIVSNLSIQMLTGGAGVGYVMPGGLQAGVAPVANTAPTLQLAPASAASPGGQQVFESDSSALDLSKFYVDGANSGDTIGVVYNTKSR